jgi:peptidoglycan/LPS O-acetylase OafA/YrhL
MDQNGMTDHKPQERIDALTSLRFFAALWVVFFHQWLTYDPQTLGSWVYQTLISKGFLGVDLFFLLSGYILAYVYLKGVQPHQVNRVFFWRARFARIYPVYALSFLIETPFIVAFVLAQQDRSGETLKALGTLLAHLALLQAYVPPLRWHWNFPSWTLSTETFFYLLFPYLGVWFWKKTEGKGWFLPFVVLYALLLAPSVIYSALGLNGVITEWNMPTLVIRFFPPFRLPEFLLGILLLRIQERIQPRITGRPWIPYLLLIGGGAGLVLALWGTVSWKALLWYGGLFDPFFMMVLLGAALAGGALGACLGWKPLVRLGDASYSIYILQIPIAEWWQTCCPSGIRNKPIGFWLYLCLLVATSLALYLLYETPLRAWIRSKGAPKS